jgi:DNA gyrase inhibitor GyrI
VSLEPFAIVATRHVGPYDTPDLKKAFRVVLDWAAARDLLSHMRGISSVPLDDPDTTPEANLVTDGFLPVV